MALGIIVDYVRGLGSDVTRERVRRHLSACAPCADAAGRVARLAAIARADAESKPPEEVVAAAIELFHTVRSGHSSAADAARLVFDSAAEAVQDENGSARHRLLRFEAAGGEISLQLLINERNVRVSVTGQITARTTGGPLNGAVTAHRESGQLPMASAVSNDNGEFSLDYDPPAAAVLHFVIAGAAAAIDALITAVNAV